MNAAHDPSSSDDPRTTVQDLVRQREQIRGWIARLDEVRGEAPDRVAERIRADYVERMGRVTEELSAHHEEIGRDLEDKRGELQEIEERRTRAIDTLEEMRLRHLIGELDDGAWGEAQPNLEADVQLAEEELGRTRDEVERLAGLASEIAGTPASVEADGTAAEDLDDVDEYMPNDALEGGNDAGPYIPQAAPLDEDATVEGWDPFPDPLDTPETASADELPWLDDSGATQEWSAPSTSGLEFLDRVDEPRTPAAPAADNLAEDDLAFLEELDRAISGNPGAPAPSAGTPAAGGDQAAAAGPAGRLLCKECGALNEPHSWYCEVCGSEL